MLYDNSRYLFFCVIVLMISGYTTLGLRIYSRVTKQNWGWDDTVASISALPFAWLCAQTIKAANNGLGAHEWNVTPEMSMAAYKAFVFFQVSYCCSIILIKASIALMLTRIICGQMYILWILRITIAVFTSVTLSVAIFCLLQCRPLAKTWNPAIEGYCHPSNVLASLSMTVTVTSIISDVIICFCPIPLLWHLQMNRNLKVVAGCLLSLGFFASICAIIRLAYTLALNSTDDYLCKLRNSPTLTCH
ncbi:hypothetical protein BK809_0004976 [Diplodia seriata]|uniref:Rhodopsin domain-containing protein n=1 Tax=Diplodia seriata TaxID=420778 RepID=A0A1S8B7V9_9PEZI|nr:hypothetical protein BK809_0004976 [Diplodia seriata]